MYRSLCNGYQPGLLAPARMSQVLYVTQLKQRPIETIWLDTLNGYIWVYKVVHIEGSDLEYSPFDCIGHCVTVTSLDRSLRLAYQKYKTSNMGLASLTRKRGIIYALYVGFIVVIS